MFDYLVSNITTWLLEIYRCVCVCVFVWGFWASLAIKGRGGVQPQKILSFVVVALVLVFPKCEWAHLSFNSKRLSRYDATKLALSRALSRICMGNPVKFVPNFNLRTRFLAMW